MQDYRVETFLAVCRTLNYTRAAEELNITQPAVSQHIAFLEKEYGAKLFSYANRKLSLTPAGELVRRTLAAMAHDDRLLRESVAACERTSALSLSIGMTLTAGEYVVAAPLATYLRAHPEMQVRLRSRGTEELLGALDEGVIDCAFVEGFFDKSAYAWDTFSTERLVAICAPGHALAGRTCAFEDLLSEHVLVDVYKRQQRARHLHHGVVHAQHHAAHVGQPLLVQHVEQRRLMRLLVFADGQGFGDFAGQRLVGKLCVRLAPLHRCV